MGGENSIFLRLGNEMRFDDHEHVLGKANAIIKLSETDVALEA